MKRLVLSVTGTIAGVAALLSFKTQTHAIANAGGLPSAALGTSSAAAAGPNPTGSTATTPATTTHPAPSGASSASTSAAAAAKSYLGSAVTTQYGIVQVKVTVQGRQITKVAFAQLTAFDGRSEQINSYAGPQLLKETLSAQSAAVDTVSGASYTSDGYRQSLQSALDQAGIK